MPADPAPLRFFRLSSPPPPPRARFLRASDYRSFLGTLRRGLATHPVRVIAYAVLPGDWHMVVGPTRPQPLLDLIRWVVATRATDPAPDGACARATCDLPGPRPS